MTIAKRVAFKHAAPSGQIFTRSTSHAYTHVVMRRSDNAVAVAVIEASRSKRIVDAVIRAGEHWAQCLLVKAAGVGGRVPYTRDQGGYGRPEGMEVRQSWYELHVEYLDDHKTVEAYVEHCRASAEAHVDRDIESTRKRSEDVYVSSWHHSYELADNAALQHCDMGDLTFVEKINNGVRDDSKPKCAKCGEIEHRGTVCKDFAEKLKQARRA